MPFMLVFKRYAPFETFGGGFEGDNRTGPSSNRGATARTIGVVDFDIATVSPKMLGYSTGTRWFKDAEMSFSKVTTQLTVGSTANGSTTFTAYTAGSNPCVPAAPDIDTFVDLTAKFAPGSVTFSGKVRGDAFPNAEVWVYDGTVGAKHVLLVDYRTGGDRNLGPATLFGTGASTTIATFNRTVLLGADGKFVASDASATVTKGS